MFVPQIWLYGLAVVSAGVLQAHQRFLAAASAPLLSSVVVIAAYLIFAGTSLVAHGAAGCCGLGTTLGVVVLALTTAVPLAPARPAPAAATALRRRRSARWSTRIAAAGIVGLVLPAGQRAVDQLVRPASADPGALTRYTWANAIYLLPYAVLAAPLLQLAFPRLAAAADSGTGAVREVLDRVPARGRRSRPGSAPRCWWPLRFRWPGSSSSARARGTRRRWPGRSPLLGPAVVGFALLGLASRTLLAQHRARDAGWSPRRLGGGDHRRAAVGRRCRCWPSRCRPVWSSAPRSAGSWSVVPRPWRWPPAGPAACWPDCSPLPVGVRGAALARSTTRRRRPARGNRRGDRARGCSARRSSSGCCVSSVRGSLPSSGRAFRGRSGG